MSLLSVYFLPCFHTTQSVNCINQYMCNWSILFLLNSCLTVCACVCMYRPTCVVVSCYIPKVIDRSDHPPVCDSTDELSVISELDCSPAAVFTCWNWWCEPYSEVKIELNLYTTAVKHDRMLWCNDGGWQTKHVQIYRYFYLKLSIKWQYERELYCCPSTAPLLFTELFSEFRPIFSCPAHKFTVLVHCHLSCSFRVLFFNSLHSTCSAPNSRKTQLETSQWT